MLRLTLKISLLVAFSLASNLCAAQQQDEWKEGNLASIDQLFAYAPGRAPLVFAHRGGTVAGLPENCIATFAYTVKTFTPFLEIDPRLTKDSVIVIMHDATLDRTTNGTGRIADHTWKELQELRLKDPHGKLTEHRIPRLDEVVKWAKGRCILLLDRKDVPFHMMAAQLKQWNARQRAVLSAFELNDAKQYHRLDSSLMLEVYIKNQAQLDEVEKSGIPFKNIIAYVSQPKSAAFYRQLHAKGLMAMVYTATVVEKEADGAKRKQAYRDIVDSGGDIILANDIDEVLTAIKGMHVGSP